jgi:hypothetical protein
LSAGRLLLNLAAFPAQLPAGLLCSRHLTEALSTFLVTTACAVVCANASFGGAGLRICRKSGDLHRLGSGTPWLKKKPHR